MPKIERGPFLELFCRRRELAIEPIIDWRSTDERHFWNVPFSQWGDYFSLRRAKKKYYKMFCQGKAVRKMPSLVPLYIKAVEKGRIPTVDYLQHFGGDLLHQYVRRRFKRRYGSNSAQWEDFAAREEIVFDRVVELRREREHQFLMKEVKEKFPIEKLMEKRRSLENFWIQKDEAARREKSVPSPVLSETRQTAPERESEVPSKRLLSMTSYRR